MLRPGVMLAKPAGGTRGTFIHTRHRPADSNRRLPALMWPQLTLLNLVALFAAYALLSGITAIVGAIGNRKKNDDWSVMLLLGIVSTGAGAGHGRQCPGNRRARYIMAAIRLGKAIESEWMLAAGGLASIAFGAIVFFAPEAGALATVWLISIYATGALPRLPLVLS
jgi:uncharacterized membrane protein HdeD (DUF308 family)